MLESHTETYAAMRDAKRDQSNRIVDRNTLFDLPDALIIIRYY